MMNLEKVGPSWILVRLASVLLFELQPSQPTAQRYGERTMCVIEQIKSVKAVIHVDFQHTLTSSVMFMGMAMYMARDMCMQGGPSAHVVGYLMKAEDTSILRTPVLKAAPWQVGPTFTARHSRPWPARCSKPQAHQGPGPTWALPTKNGV